MRTVLPGLALPQLPAADQANQANQVAADATGCFHCGQPLPAGQHWPVRMEHVERLTCCPGCQAVAQTIAATGLSDYYRTRTAFPAQGGGTENSSPPAELRLYDEPETLQQFAKEVGPAGGAMDSKAVCEATLSVEGLRCAACVWLIETRLARVAGVQACTMNVGTGRLHVRWDKHACKPSDILQALRAIGYSAYPFDAARQEGQLQHAARQLFRRLFVAALSMMQVMMYAVPAYLADDGSLEADMDSLMRWASLLLTLPALCYSAQPFFQGAWAALKQWALGMDVPVALGIAAAFLGSAVATWRGQGAVYFDTVTMFIFLLLCSRYLELGARRKAASSLQALSHALPQSATRLSDYPATRAVETVAAATLAAGDVVLVKPGEAIPADGVLIEGSTSIDVSLLTGESQPLNKVQGDLLPGGAVNAAQPILLRVERATADSTLSALVKLIERCGQTKPQMALWADKVAAWFVAVLLLFAVAVFIYWQIVQPERAWPIAVAVLVVSCPCALSLATPSALAAATDFLVRRGVLVVRSHVLETLHHATHVVFDKTGTLTQGKPRVQRIATIGDASEAQVLQVAAALELSNAHPLGLALVAEAKLRGLFCNSNAGASTAEVHYVAGQGIEGLVDGVRYRIGCAAFVAGIAGANYFAHCTPNADDDTTSVYLGAQGKWLARFDCADTLRPDAQQTIAHFQYSGKTVILLSGDQVPVTQRTAALLGIHEAHGACLPQDKVDFVQQLQRGGAVVAMIGDGINDAAVLRTADVSFAMGSGATLAQSHADVVLLSGRLASLREAAVTAARTMSVIRQNLAWSMLYNLIAIPAAALGWISPWLAGIGMSLSSAVVVLNALRLRRSRKE